MLKRELSVEGIVVNDGSTYGSRHDLRKVGFLDQVVYIPQPNQITRGGNTDIEITGDRNNIYR